jgi:hypothetical protein
MHFSVSPMEKTDAQIQVTRVGFVPETDTRSMEAGGNLWPTLLKNSKIMEGCFSAETQNIPTSAST